MRVIVAGSMKWTDEEAIRRELRTLPPGSVVVHGDCPGADEIAGRIAREELGLPVEAMAKNEEDRRRYQKFAWMRLNERMVAGGVDLVLVFHELLDVPGEARGSNHLLSLVRPLGVQIRTFTGRE